MPVWRQAGRRIHVDQYGYGCLTILNLLALYSICMHVSQLAMHSPTPSLPSAYTFTHPAVIKFAEVACRQE